MAYTLPWKRRELTEVWNWPHIFLLNFFGLWAEEASTKFQRRLLSHWRVFTITFIIGSVMSIVISILNHFANGDIAQSLFSVFLLEPTAVGVFKTIQVTKHRRSLKLAMNKLDELTRKATDPTEKELIKENMVRMWFVFLSNVSLTCSTMIHYLARPLLIALFYGERTRMLDTWPELNDNWTQFTISYVYQTCCTFFLAFAWTSFDNIFFCTSQYILCHIGLLGRRLENLHLKDSPEEFIEVRNILTYHKDILQICQELKNASEGILIIQTISLVLLYCSGLFIINMSGNLDINKLLNILETATVTSLYLYLTCWYSSEITLQLDGLRNSIYMSDWQGGNKSHKKCLLIMMTRTVQPLTFGGFLKLKLNTFVNVLKSAFSYYNFLTAVMSTDDAIMMQ